MSCTTAGLTAGLKSSWKEILTVVTFDPVHFCLDQTGGDLSGICPNTGFSLKLDSYSEKAKTTLKGPNFLSFDMVFEHNNFFPGNSLVFQANRKKRRLSYQPCNCATASEKSNSLPPPLI